MGKSAIPLTIGLLQTGVTLSMVPLVGLGSDQVNKISNDDNLIEANYLNEHRGDDGKALRDCLLALNEQEAGHVSIFLYALPQSLQVSTFWYQCLLTLSSCNMIWLIVIDEAHTIAQDGHSFRLEFLLAVHSLKGIYNNQQTKCNRIAMSETFRQSDQDIISNLFGKTPGKIMWLELSWHGIHFDVVISGSPSSSISQSVVQDYKYPMQMKTIIYINSKKQA